MERESHHAVMRKSMTSLSQLFWWPHPSRHFRSFWSIFSGLAGVVQKQAVDGVEGELLPFTISHGFPAKVRNTFLQRKSSRQNIFSHRAWSRCTGLCHDIVGVVFFHVLLGLQSLGWVGHRSQNAFDRMYRWQTVIENFNSHPNFHAPIVTCSNDPCTLSFKVCSNQLWSTLICITTWTGDLS